MFDAGARCGDAAIALLLCIGDALGGAAFALEVDVPAGFFHASRSGGG